GHGYRSSSHARASVNGRPAKIPAPVITIAKVRRLNIASLPSPRGRWAYTGPSQWRHIDANGALFAQSGVGKVNGSPERASQQPQTGFRLLRARLGNPPARAIHDAAACNCSSSLLLTPVGFRTSIHPVSVA